MYVLTVAWGKLALARKRTSIGIDHLPGKIEREKEIEIELEILIAN